MQKGFSPIFILIGIVVIAVALFTPIPRYQKEGPCLMIYLECDGRPGWYLSPSLFQSLISSLNNNSALLPKPSQAPQISPTPSSIDKTASWKTYTNTKYGFSIKYPNSWFSNDCGGQDIFLLNPKEQIPPSCASDANEPIHISTNSQEKTEEEYKEALESSSFKVTNKIVLDQGVLYKVEKTEPAPGPDKFSVIVIPTKTNVILITVYDQKYESNAKQIFSTFKFTDSISECKVTGCSKQICAEEDVISTCEWKETYACYNGATCERQASGECGWIQTAELTRCLQGVNETAEGKACGGFGGEQGQLACPTGFKCEYPKPMYPDAQGKCVKK